MTTGVDFEQKREKGKRYGERSAFEQVPNDFDHHFTDQRL
jgi:hypothetical protein